jgi:hypothetical protein
MTNSMMAFEHHQKYQDFMDQNNETWVWKYEYDHVLSMLHYVARTAKEMGCDVPRRAGSDMLWWEPLQEKKDD